TLTVQEMEALGETFTERQIVTLSETLTEAQLKEVTEVMTGRATGSLTENFTTQELKNLSETLTGDQLEKLVRNVGDDAGMIVLEHVTGLGSREALERMPANRFMMELLAKAEDNAVASLTQAAKESGVPEAVIRAAARTRNPVEELATAVARSTNQEIVTSSAADDLMAVATRLMQNSANDFEKAFVQRAIREAEARGANYFEELGRKVVVSGEQGIEQVLNPDVINQLRNIAVKNGWITP
ncbi:MAG: hypothetical protein K8I00_07675, partial [Candidatus Omnitrophica bacterium]|nr:hypothetical protein [Candidatus Omnitrophota bacterium]